MEKPTRREVGHSGMMNEQPLNQVQEEAAEILGEECVELAQECLDLAKACSKLKRCGLAFIASNHPELGNFKQQFSAEIADVLCCIDEAIEAGLVDFDALTQTLDSKPAKLRRFTKHLGYAPVRYANPLLMRIKLRTEDND